MTFKEYLDRTNQILKHPEDQNPLEIKINRFIPFPEKHRPTEIKVSIPTIKTKEGITLEKTDPIFQEYEKIWGRKDYK